MELAAADFLHVVPPDGMVHLASPGHVRALCGRDRVTNADVTERDAECLDCLSRAALLEEPQA